MSKFAAVPLAEAVLFESTGLPRLAQLNDEPSLPTHHYLRPRSGQDIPPRNRKNADQTRISDGFCLG